MRNDILHVLNVPEEQLEHHKGEVIGTTENGDQVLIQNSLSYLFPRRAILRAGKGERGVFPTL